MRKKFSYTYIPHIPNILFPIGFGVEEEEQESIREQEEEEQESIREQEEEQQESIREQEEEEEEEIKYEYTR